jgi:hypothetical protein
MPTIITKGNISASAYGLSLGKTVKPVYSNSVFSTYLYTGTSANQTITNGVDLADNGGMVWIKSRSYGYNNNIFDTVRGANNFFVTNTISPQNTSHTDTLTSFNNNGFSLGADSSYQAVNNLGYTYASWTFQKQTKFFDIQSFTTDSSGNATVAHALGSTPGCIIFKAITVGENWQVYHQNMNGGVNANQYVARLNTTSAQISVGNTWITTSPTSFSLVNGALLTPSTNYIAYIFADNAGGFGTTGTDNIISCGSYTGTGAAGNFVSLGYEPQWVLVKDISAAGNWVIEDIMRNMSQLYGNELFPNLANAETALNPSIVPAATGFYLNTTNAAFNSGGSTYIYIAIRRPMAVPTTGTSVFFPQLTSNPATTTSYTTGFPVDLTIFTENNRSIATYNSDIDRLRGTTQYNSMYLDTDTTAAENSYSPAGGLGFASNTSVTDGVSYPVLGITDATTYWNFARAPGFFDEVCYTGTGSNTTQTHNLGVVPQMIIIKDRSSGGNNWVAYCQPNGTSYNPANSNVGYLNDNFAFFSYPTVFNSTAPTSTQFSLGNTTLANVNSHTYVAYLFATCPGVSYVGSFTGTGGTQSIPCGFGSGGARFILIKRTDSTGDWYCFDSANGLTSTSSPYLLWDNTSTAQVTGNNGCYASSGGFTLTSNASATININGGSYIFLSVA